MTTLSRLAIVLALWACGVAAHASSVDPLNNTDVVPINGDLSASQLVDASKVDSNYASIVSRFNALLTALKTIQRSDNTVMDRAVKLYSLSPEVVAVLGSVGGWQPKAAVACASTANLTLSGEQTVDGVLTSASRILVKNQTAGAQNGIYVTGAGAWTRATDADSALEIGYAAVTVTGGATNLGTSWVVTAAGTAITLDTTALTWAQFGSLGISVQTVKATGTTTSRLLADRFADVFNVLDFGALGDGATNDTAAVAAAIAAASSAGGKIVYFPPGKYLVTGNLSLANVTLAGPEVGDGESPYSDNGAQIWETNTSNPMFTVDGMDVTVRGLVFYYPNQDGSGATPTTYAPTFQFSTTASIGNVNFFNDQWTNAYRAIVMNGTASFKHGRVMVSHCRATALSHFLEAKYVADIVTVDNCEITPGIWQDIALTGNAYPAKWMSDNGEAFVIDTQCDGLYLSDCLVFGYNKGIKADTGSINWLSCHQTIFDQCTYGIYGNNAALNYLVVDGCHFWSTHSYTNTVLGASIHVGGAATGSMAVTGCAFGKSYGCNIEVPAQQFRAVTITGNVFLDWATGTGIGADQYAVLLNNDAGGDVTITGNVFSCQGSPTFNAAVGVLADNAQIVGNTFRKCKVCVNVLGAGKYVVQGNSSVGTVGTTCFQQTSATSIAHGGNLWDISTAGIVDSVTATVTFPAINTLTSNLQTVAVPGCVVNDVVILGGPVTTGSNGIIYQAFVSVAGTVTVEALNFTAGTVTPGALVFRITIAPRG